MESKKVKVKLVVGYKQYRVIEVEESEVEKITLQSITIRLSEFLSRISE